MRQCKTDVGNCKVCLYWLNQKSKGAIEMTLDAALQTWWGGIILLALLAAVFYFIYYNPAAQKHWERLLTREQYQAQHPECVRGTDLACCHCGSTEQLDFGATQYKDWRRQMMCRQCKTLLWREEDK